MMIRRSFLSFVFVLAMGAVLAMAPLAVKAGETTAGAQKFISSLADEAVSSLAGPDVERPERVKRFRSLLNEHFAIQTIGRWVLGRYWRKASSTERKEYLELFEELIIITYIDRFTKYGGEKLIVSKSIAVGKKDIVVYSKVDLPGGDTSVRVDWRVRKDKKGDFKIIDVMVEGVSMGQTQRSEFASAIKKAGNGVAGLLKELRRRVRNEA